MCVLVLMAPPAPRTEKIHPGRMFGTVDRGRFELKERRKRREERGRQRERRTELSCSQAALN